MDKKISLFFLLCLIFFLAPIAFSYVPTLQTSGATAGKWTTDLSAAVNLAKTNGNYIVIFFGGSSCPLCDTAMRHVFDTDTFYNWSIEKRVPLVYANGSNQSAQPAATVLSKYENVKFYPTIIFVDGATNTKIKSIVFRSSEGYSTFDDFIGAAPAVTPGVPIIPDPVCTTEICNGLDDDCDGQIDEGFTKNAYYLDNDQDGFGAGSPLYSCAAPYGAYVLPNTDCNDSNPSLRPGVSEVCDGIGNDCDGQIDEGFDCIKGSLNCTVTCQFETKRINSCLGAVPQNAFANKVDNKYSEKWNGSAWVVFENNTYKYDSSPKDCTYSCNTYYYNSGGSCVPYICSAGSIDLNNSVMCEKDNTQLTSATIKNLLVSSCSIERKCEYQCNSGFYLGLVNNERKCLVYEYQCSSALDGNSVIYEGDDSGLTSNVDSVLVEANSPNKCEYHCKSNFILNSTKNKCIPNPFVCTDSQLLDKNTVIYVDDNLDLSANTKSKLVASNSVDKCEYHCNDGYYKGSGADENNCLPSKYYCTGSVDSNAIMYPDENINLDSNLKINLVEFNGPRKCEWYCNSGYKPGSGLYSTVCVSEVVRACDGNIDPNAEMYVGDDANISILDNWTNILVLDNSSLKCEWHCKSGYYLDDSNSGYVCLPEHKENFFCTGLIDGNAVIFSGDDRGLDSNFSKVLVDVNTFRKCEYFCKGGFYLGSVSGVGVCLPSRYSCKGSINGAIVYLGDDSGLVGDLNVVLVESNTSRKCEYHCANNYTKVGDACVLSTVKNAVCGNAERGFLVGESFPGSYSLCDAGVSSLTNPVLDSEVGSIAQWSCTFDTNANCSATRVSSPYVSNEEETNPSNSILKVSSKMLDDGNIEVTLKCAKTTVINLDIIDYLTKEPYTASQNQLDCTASESTHKINLTSASNTERSIIVMASLGGNKADCSTCELNYFMDYSPVNQVSEEPFPIYLILVIIVIIGIVLVAGFILLKKVTPTAE